MRRSFVAAMLALTLLAWPAHAQLFPTSPFETPAATPTPEPAVRPTKEPTHLGEFNDIWGRSMPPPMAALVLVIDEYGMATIRWRTGGEASGDIGAGRAGGFFYPPKGSVMDGRLYSSNDEQTVKPGPMTFELIGDHRGRLTLADQSWVLCSMKFAMDEKAAGRPEPECGP